MQSDASLSFFFILSLYLSPSPAFSKTPGREKEEKRKIRMS
jgi:hypothetical protein